MIFKIDLIYGIIIVFLVSVYVRGYTMRHLIFVEGLWGTGKSYFLRNYAKSITDTNTLLFDNLRDYGTVRHAAYVIHPNVYKTQNLIFDRSPVTLKVLANSDLDLYTHPTIRRSYWDDFYDDWLNVLREQSGYITFIYFKPFDIYGYLAESVIKRVLEYDKPNLMINIKKFREIFLHKIHELYILEVEYLSRLMFECNKSLKVQLYPVEFRDEQCAAGVMNMVLSEGLNGNDVAETFGDCVDAKWRIMGTC